MAEKALARGPAVKNAVGMFQFLRGEKKKMISIAQLVIFFLAWVFAQIFIEVIKGVIRQRQVKRMVDEVYLKISKLAVSTFRDYSQYKKNS